MVIIKELPSRLQLISPNPLQSFYPSPPLKLIHWILLFLITCLPFLGPLLYYPLSPSLLHHFCFLLNLFLSPSSFSDQLPSHPLPFLLLCLSNHIVIWPTTVLSSYENTLAETVAHRNLQMEIELPHLHIQLLSLWMSVLAECYLFFLFLFSSECLKLQPGAR